MRFSRSVLLLALLLGAAPAPAADYNPKMHKDEWRYVDAEDEEEAAELLAKLLKRHDSERKAAKLVETLKKGRPYMKGLDRSETLDHACADGKTRQFTYYIPSRYSPGRPTGVLVFLHGAVRQPPPGGGAHEARDIGKAVDDLEYIKIGPSTYEGAEWGQAAVRELVHYALDTVKQRFNVDEDRVYLAGDSDGGRGTYAILETEATSYAAAVPVIGAPGGVTRFANLRNLPFFAINGTEDSIFEFARVKELADQMKGCGFDLEFKAIEGGKHNPFFFVEHGDEVRKFLTAHPRTALPPVVDWQVDPGREGYEQSPAARTFRWIRIEETGKAPKDGEFDDWGPLIRRDLPRLCAKKLEGNRVEVTTWQVKRFTILVSDEMFDLDEPIEIVVNGTVRFAEKLAPDARVALEEARLLNDRKLVFSNRVTLSVTAE